MRAPAFVCLLCAWLACSGTGLSDKVQFEVITVTSGFSGLTGVSFRAGELKDTTLTKPQALGLDGYLSVVENGLGVSGKVVITTTLETPPGVYPFTVTNAGHALTFRVEVKAAPSSATRETARLSTVGLSKSLLYALKEDGTVWREALLGGGSDAPVRVAGLYGVQAVSRDSALTLEGQVISLEAGYGPRVTSLSQHFSAPNGLDLRDGYVLTNDGHVMQGSRVLPGLVDVVAFRSFEFNQGGQHGLVNTALLAGGAVVTQYLDDSIQPTKISGAQDLAQVASGFLRGDGVVFGYSSDTDATLRPISGTAPVIAFEGTGFVDGKDVAFELPLFVTGDGAVHVREKRLPAFVSPAIDVAGRENQLLVWLQDGTFLRSNLISDAPPSTKLTNVRRPGQVADANVFGASVSLKRGETKEVIYRVVRRGAHQALTLTPTRVPPGVTVNAASIAADATTVTLTWSLAAGVTIEPRNVEFELRGTNFLRTTFMPVLVAAEPRLHTIGSTSYATFFIKNDGVLWGFGQNLNGDLGLPPDTVVRAPAPITHVPKVKSVVGSGANALALDESGVVWTWGSQGGLGYPTPADVQPRPVPGLPPIVSIAYGRFTSIALDASGTVWTWSVSQVAPVAAAGLPKIIEVSGFDEPHALDAEGNAWALGGVKLLKRYGPASAEVPCARLGFARVDGASGKAFATCLPGDGLPANDGQLILDMPGSGQVISQTATGVRFLNAGGLTAPYGNTQDTVDATVAIGQTAKIFALKLDGTLWQGFNGGSFTQVSGVGDIRLP